MKITAVQAYLLQLPLIKPYTIAYKTFTDTGIVFLEITLANGMVGYGAANPFEDVVGETPADTLQHLQSDYVQTLIGQNIEAYHQLIQNAASYFSQLPGTLAAIDIALHDAFAQYSNIPVVQLYGQLHKSIPTSVTIGIKETAEMLEEAKACVAAGFTILKLKTGISVEADIERVSKIAEALHGAVVLRVDANQGYTISQLQQFVKATSHLPIELIEQPMPVSNDHQLAMLPLAVRNKLVADESLINQASAIQLAQSPQPYGVYNIKLMKCGGILAAKAIAATAQQAGIHLFWGCNDESLVSITAALHAAFSSPNTRYLDLDGSFDIAETLFAGGFILKNGCMHINPTPGLGVVKNIF
ncbi:mandelate racemase/muconate lactonizing enzyme family protein [Limnovirga soli]|uniref:Dipeptide epimerase n=1 Tax=Limnovirga soli TaxID=2656915 RepID=A0A8J8FFI5_9BACT|nr:dipeptide epimerase [Limnovirga soli]NNV55672.1 dipeptide epimerase [Limnovirga soli]